MSISPHWSYRSYPRRKEGLQWSNHDILTILPNIIKNNFMQRRIIGTELQIVDGVLNPLADVTKYGKEFGLFTKEDGTPLKSGGKWHYDGVYLGSKETDMQEYLLNHVEMYGKIYGEVCALASHTALSDNSKLYASNNTETSEKILPYNAYRCSGCGTSIFLKGL